MAAAALRVAGNPDRQGARIWGQLAFGELQVGTSDPAVIPNPIIPIQAGSKRRRSTEDVTARRIESNETGVNSLCENCRSEKSENI